MTVSVVITCFNLGRYIGEAIESAYRALDGRSGEIVVVDDCSTDGSAAIIQSFPDVRYVRTETNAGVMLATLEGVLAARHDRIAFLDGDDIWSVGKLAAIDDAFDADPAVALITHDLRYVDNEGVPLDRVSAPSRTARRLTADRWNDWIRRSIVDHAGDVWLGSALSVDRTRGRLADFDRWIRRRGDARDLYQDWPMALWVALQPGARCAYVPDKLFDYRLHDANHSGDARTFSRAVRNFRRARNTLRAMKDIAEMHDLPAVSLGRDLALSEGQVALMEGRRGKALISFVVSLPGLLARPRELAKEAVRFGVLSLLGPDRGHRLTRKLSGHA